MIMGRTATFFVCECGDLHLERPTFSSSGLTWCTVPNSEKLLFRTMSPWWQVWTLLEAGTTTAFSSGDAADRLGEYAWIGDNTYLIDEKYAHRVGLKKPNRFGLYDMHGNVWEWCEDGYDDDFYGRSPSDDPVNATEASSRVLRGGGWGHSSRYCRSAVRYGNTPVFQNFSLGFRLARSLGE